MWQIGLTGGIGSGKSTVARCWVALGATLVDTDAIARSLTAPGGAALPAVIETFGPEIIGADGAMDRNQMRARAFADPPALRRLEGILHPLIEHEALRQRMASASPVVVFDVPLLAESSRWRRRVDRVLVVDCEEATQVARVVARSGWSEEQVRAVMDRQARRPERRRVADAVIYNDGLSIEGVQAEVHALWRAWLSPLLLADATASVADGP